MKIEAWTMAEYFLKDHLKSPSTARFGGILSGDYQNPKTCVTYLGNNDYRVKGWVDSQNTFGGIVRTNFSLRLRYNGNKSWTLVESPVMVTRQ